MFEQITPEQAGVASSHVKNFIEALEKRGVRMHSVLLAKGDRLFGEYYWAPFDADFCHRMYSQTKSFVSIAIGLLEEDGLVDLDERIAHYFPDRIDEPLPALLAEQTVREMLTMTTVGHIENWFSERVFDRTRYYFTRSGALRPSGTVWEYDSAGSQVLSSLVETLSGKSLLDFLRERVFEKLGTFKTAKILKAPNGDSWGDSALLCTTRDMVSFARFVMNGGRWNGEQLLNEAYLKKATSRQVDNSLTPAGGAFRHGYGYQIWRTEQNGFAFLGMGDQITVCLPELDLIFACTADNQGAPFFREYLTNCFFDHIASNVSPVPLPQDDAAYAALCARTKELALFALHGAADSPLRQQISDKAYVCEKNPLGWCEFSLCFASAEQGELRYVKNGKELVLPFFVNKNKFGLFPELGYSGEVGGVRTADGSRYRDAVSAAWLQENKLRLFVQIIDQYFGNTSLSFSFRDGLCTVTAEKTAEDFLWDYQGEIVARRKES